MKVKSFFRILGGFSQHGLLRRVKSLDTTAPVECNTRTLYAFVKENWERRHITSVSCSSEREERLPPEPFMLLGWTLRDSQQVRGIPWLSLCSCEFLISGRPWGSTGSHGLQSSSREWPAELWSQEAIPSCGVHKGEKNMGWHFHSINQIRDYMQHLLGTTLVVW